MKPLEFKCPKCGLASVDEIKTGVTLYNKIKVYPDGVLKYGDEESVHENSPTHYICRGCTYRLEGVCDGSSLVEWITRYCTFSIETIRSKLGVAERQALIIRAILFDMEPIRHEGNHISTAHRYLGNTDFTHTPILSDLLAVICAISIEIGAAAHSVPAVHWLWYVAASDSKEKLAYHRKEEYYFWATSDELSEMEAKWIKKNSS